ncbi:SGNH hydrolase-type esterase domain-containing protein [Syncephalastrum racemosum]|uniref:SGNH hydrolase-type esterase domain-containing protein n=1 Tax=Syncephalastrum racemosum TaxID=13706 RepID=A0A1X2H5F3_SYNRA|nr:SGNH hydrolase-type esterase domain-containing protein [Syncephalastrum racemosum]
MKTAAFLSLFAIAGATSVQALDRIIAFADSYTDNGNDYANSGFPPSPPYWKGRFSDGPTWLEYVADNLKGIDVINHGHGGATTDNEHAYSEFNGYVVPGAVQQVEQSDDNGTENDLYIISIGYNDLNGIINPDMAMNYKYTKEDVARGVLNTVKGIQKKYNGKEFLFQNVAPFYHWPVIQKDDKDRTKSLINEYNSLVESEVKKIKGIKAKFMDINSWFEEAIANPEKYGLRTDNGACDPGIGKTDVCEDPEKHFYFDSYHPQAKIHKAWGEWATDYLTKAYDFGGNGKGSSSN